MVNSFELYDDARSCQRQKEKYSLLKTLNIAPKKGLSYILYFMFFLLLYWMRYSVYFSRLIVRGGPFCSIFSFFVQWSNDWPKHVVGSNKLNVQKFRGCVRARGRACTGLLLTASHSEMMLHKYQVIRYEVLGSHWIDFCFVTI